MRRCRRNKVIGSFRNAKIGFGADAKVVHTCLLLYVMKKCPAPFFGLIWHPDQHFLDPEINCALPSVSFLVVCAFSKRVACALNQLTHYGKNHLTNIYVDIRLTIFHVCVELGRKYFSVLFK